LRARVNLTSAANPNIAIWCQAPARADTAAVPVAIPEATSASTDKTASAAAAHVDRTAATHVHRAAPTAASHTSAADMHPAAAADAGMHPTGRPRDHHRGPRPRGQRTQKSGKEG
jgi:hypothetical protein